MAQYAKSTTDSKKFHIYDPETMPALRNDYQVTDYERDCIRRVYDRRFQMESAPDRVRIMANVDKWMKQWDAWRVDRRENEMELWQANHYVPLTLGVIESALAEMIDQTPQPMILPRGSEDIPKATVMKRIFEYTWEIADGDAELYNVLKDALILGTGIAQEYYWKDRRIVKEGDVEKEVFDYDDCYMETVRLQDFFVDENARAFTGPFGARDCIRRYIMDVNDVRLFFRGPVWDPFDAVKYVKPGGDTNYYEFYKPPEGIDKGNQVEVLWYWSKKPDDKLIIVANDVLLVDGPNPYKHKQLPFARVVDVKRPHTFYGKGESELLESTQDESNLIRRMTLDRNHLDIDKMFVGSQNAQLDDEDLRARPHGFIPTDDPANFKAVEYSDIPRSIELSMGKLQEDSLRATGINDLSTSVPSIGTATEAAILKETTLKRIRMKLRILEREFLVPIARLRVANIIQFYAQPRLEKIVGEESSQEFEKAIMDLQARGELVVDDGNFYQKSYREIRLQDREISNDAKGAPYERQKPGFSFFKAKPEYFIPVARGGFDIKFVAGSTIPISKTLKQTKDAEMYDRLIQLADPILPQGPYSAVKLGDELLRSNDYNPEDYKNQPAQEQVDVGGQQLQQQLSLALEENKLMMQGQRVPPLAFASPAHTRIHAEFMQSKPWQEIPPNDPRVQNFTDHVMGEMMTQEARGVATGSAMPQGGQPGGGLTPPTTPGQGTPTQVSSASKVGGPQGGNPNLTATIPALVQGGGQAPSAV